MGMLDRYQKNGGFLQLVSLIESFPPAKQEKFLGLIREENAAWEAELQKRLIRFPQILQWHNDVVAEIWPRIPEKFVATAIWNLDAEGKEKFFSSFSQSQRRKLEQYFAMNAPAEAEIISCQIKVVQEVRSMSQSGLIRLEKFAPDLIIPEKIEDQLSSGLPPSSVGISDQKLAQMLAPGKETNVPTSSPAAVMLVEEMKELRRKLQSAIAENAAVREENKVLKDKLEQIRKIA